MSNIYKYIQKISLANVERPTEAYVLRKIARVFAKTFNVSLLEAEKQDIVYLLTHIYENRFEEMEDKERLAAARELIKTDTELAQERASQLDQEQDDELWLQRLEEELKKEQAAKEMAALAPLPEDVEIKFD